LIADRPLDCLSPGHQWAEDGTLRYEDDLPVLSRMGLYITHEVHLSPGVWWKSAASQGSMNSMLVGSLEFKLAIKVSPFSTVLKLAWTSNFPQKTGSRVKPGMTLFLGLMKRCFRAGVAE